MSDLRRWSEDGATPEELSLLKASRGERPSSSARTRTLAAIGVGAAVTATSATASATAASVSLLLKLLGVGVLLGGIAIGGLVWHAHRSATPPIAAAPAAAIESAESADLAPVAVDSADPVVDPTVAPTASATASIATPAPTSRSSAPPSLAREVAALERAHAALSANDPKAVLRALDRYHAQFPHGVLASEEAVLRVKALLAEGETAKANAISSAHPDDPYARRVQDLVREAEKK